MNKFKVIVKKISPFIKPYRWAFFGAIIFIISAAIFNALAPVTEGLIITQLTEDSFNIMKGIEGAGVNFRYVIKVMIVLGVVYVSSTASTYIASFLLTNAIQNTVKGLRNAVQDKIRRLPISYFDGNSYGDVLSRITNDVDTISNALQQSFVQVVNSFLSITLALIMMFTINIKMAFIAIFIIPLSILVSRFIVSKSQNLFYRQQKALGKLNGKVQEMYS
ncbi:MAG: ABC transporter ATP-binding protein, partial [Clostridium paraputrificum]